MVQIPDMPTVMKQKNEYLLSILPSNFCFLKEQKISAEAGAYLWDHPIENSEYYRANTDAIEAEGKRYQEYLSSPEKLPLYIQDLRDGRGHGVYCLVDIPADTLVGPYIGIVSMVPFGNNDYAWKWPGENVPDQTDQHRLAIDSKYYGDGMMRFVNHSDHPNIKITETVYNSCWCILYVSTMKIPAGQEILVSYSADYWQTRSLQNLKKREV